MANKLFIRTSKCQICGKVLTYASTKPRRFCSDACYMRFWRRATSFKNNLGKNDRFSNISLIETPEGTRVYGAIMLEKAIRKSKGPCEDWLYL